MATRPAGRSFNDEREHYKSLISLFKYSVTIITTVITLIGGALAWITYSNGQEMREAMQQEKENLKSEVAEMKAEVGEERERLQNLEKEMFSNVYYVRNQTDQQISVIRDEASVMAKTEARNRIDQVFKDNNFEGFVEDVARDRMEPQIKDLVDKNMQAFLDKVQKEKIDNAIAQITEGDMQDITIGLQSLQLTIFQGVFLSDDQIIRVLSFAERDDVVKELRWSICPVLAYQKVNPLIDEFFILGLSETNINSTLRTYAMMYFLRTNIGVTTYQKIIERAANKIEMFQIVVANVSQADKPLAIEILNSKKIVDIACEGVKKDEQINLRQNIFNNLVSNGVDSFEVKKTFFFNAP